MITILKTGWRNPIKQTDVVNWLRISEHEIQKAFTSVVAMAVISMSKNFNIGLKIFAHKLNWHKSACTGVNCESNNRILSIACAKTLMPWIGAVPDLIMWFVNKWQRSASKIENKNNKHNALHYLSFQYTYMLAGRFVPVHHCKLVWIPELAVSYFLIQPMNS